MDAVYQLPGLSGIAQHRQQCSGQNTDGTLATSLIFLSAILATVVCLALSRSDVAETHELTHQPSVTTNPRKERIALGAFGALAAVTVGLLSGPTTGPTSPATPPAGARPCRPARRRP